MEYAPYPGYQVAGAATVRPDGALPTSAVGLISSVSQAEAIVAGGQADAVMLGREMLRDPYWVRKAATELGEVGRLQQARYHRAHV